MVRLAAVILAGGKGTRMKSDLPKAMLPLMGRPMVDYVVESARGAGADRIVVVVGYRAEVVQQHLGDSVEYAMQAEQLGTGHALQQAERVLGAGCEHILALAGDNPLIGADILRGLYARHVGRGAAATVLTGLVQDPFGLGRVVRGEGDEVLRIVEEKDATAAEKLIREINTSIYCFRVAGLWDALRLLQPDNAQREYQLTDITAILTARGERVIAHATEDESSLLFPNNREQLAAAEEALRRRILQQLVRSGVSVVDPESTYVEPTVRVGRNTALLPFTRIEGATEIGEGCVIGPHTRLSSCQVGDGSTVEQSVLVGARIGPGVKVGPFAHITKGGGQDEDG